MSGIFDCIWFVGLLLPIRGNYLNDFIVQKGNNKKTKHKIINNIIALKNDTNITLYIMMYKICLIPFKVVNAIN